MKYAILCLAIPLVVSLCAIAAPKTGDWTAWRGPSSNGSALEGDYPTKWTPEDATWKIALPGIGSSTPIVWRDRIFLTTPADGQDALLALDANGKQIWLTKFGAESAPRHRTLASSCNASPVTDGEGVFARFRSGRLIALNLDGTIRWQFNIDERYGPEELYWDQGSSPMLAGDLLIVSRLHHGKSWVAGFDKQTGKQRWLQERNYVVPAENDNGYTTPVLFDYKGRPALLIWGGDHLTAHSAADGALLWSCGGFNPAGTVNWPAIATPVIHNGIAMVPVGRDDRPNQARMHAIRMDGSGDVTGSHRLWERDDVGVFCCTPVEYKGRIFLLRHRGGIVCLDPATGKTIWSDAFKRSSSSYYASPVIAKGVLYATREDGTIFAARVEDKFELLSENAMGERVIASPSLTASGLLIRGEKHLFLISAKAP